jgi:hypothetical protein
VQSGSLVGADSQAAEIPQHQYSGQSLLHCRAETNSLLIGRPGGCRSCKARAPPQSTTTAARVAKQQGSELRLRRIGSKTALGLPAQTGGPPTVIIGGGCSGS